MSLRDNVDKLCKEYPELIKYLKLLNDNNIRWAIFAGASVSLLTNNRPPTDIDIFIHNNDLEAVLNLKAKAEHKLPLECDVIMGDGKVSRYCGNELQLNLDDTELELMSHAKQIIGNHTYDISFTDLAVENRIVVSTPETTIYIANPFDTAAIKAIMQRGPQQNKFDFEDVKNLVAKCEFKPSYIAARSAQIGLGKREIDFLKQAGLKIAK